MIADPALTDYIPQAGATGVVGESIIPTVIDMHCSLTQKSELLR